MKTIDEILDEWYPTIPDEEHNGLYARDKVKLIAQEFADQFRQPAVMAMLPSVDDAGVIAVNVVSNVKPKLTTQEEAMFIAGFQECVKYLSMQGKGN